MFSLLGLGTEASAAKLAAKNARVTLLGDSTLHPFASTATRVDVAAEGAGGLGGLSGLVVTIPVAGLASGEKGLDKNLQAALDAAKHPDIVFRLERYEVVSSTFVRASGTLSISGTEKPVVLEAGASAEGGGVRYRGREELLMTDYGVKPPKLFLGAIKVRDRVEVVFDLVLEPAS